jgi:predicted acyl esterase
MKFRILALVMIVVLGAVGTADIHARQGASKQTEMVPMPDGVRLATDIYFPEGDGPWPVVLIRTPYDRTSDTQNVDDLAANGIVTVVQDMRGRFESEGEDGGFYTDKEDGQATLDWIDAQPWSNGTILTFGGSALGIVQYLMAPGAPESLRCQWINVGTPDLYTSVVYQDGAYRYELAELWAIGQGSEYLIDRWKSHYLNDSFWDPVQITDDFDQVHVSAVHMGGWYDIFARGIIEGFLGYQNLGGEGAAGEQFLVMGAWAHNMNPLEVGELAYPNSVTQPYDDLIMQWLTACLAGEENPAQDLPSVAYFTMGAVGEEDAPGNEWHTAATWPPENTHDVPIYLHANNALSLDPPTDNESGDTYTYDPENPVETLGGANLTAVAGAYDQTSIEQRDDVIVYSSDVLPTPLEITGNVHADIWFSTDVPDTDIVVRLTDVYPDGRSMLIMDGIARARFRNSPDFSSEEMLEPNTPTLITVDLGPTSIIVNAGHRIRISVTSSNAPRFAPNPNTGEMFLGETTQIAHTTILHDAAHPSTIVLPVR